jgi:predicted transcriptional regulator
MNTIELKTDLHNLIDKINDVNILNAIKVLLSKKTKEFDWYDELDSEQKKSIEQGLNELDNGEGIPNESIMAEVRKLYKI